MSYLRVGLVGFGLAGRVFHAPLIEAVDGLSLSAIVTSRRKEVLAAYPAAEQLERLDDLWDRCDLVVVATPNSSHVPIAREAVDRGLPVVVDKPLAVTPEDAGELVEHAGGRGVPLTVFHNRRWDDDFVTARRLVEGGELGEVIRLESRFERFRPQVAAEAWREADPAEGGGILLDIGPHLVDQAALLLGPVESVYAEVDRRRPGVRADDEAFLALRHSNGARSQLRMSAVAPLLGDRLRLNGTTAGLSIEGFDPQEEQLRTGITPGSHGYGRRSAWARLVDGEGERTIPLDEGSYQTFYEGVVDWLAAGGEPPVDSADAVAGLRVLAAARLSAAQGHVVELSPN
jgi:scyllo-inositol 2-dehydrogenase (NADP+)